MMVEINPPEFLRELFFTEADEEIVRIERALRREDSLLVAACAQRVAVASMTAGAELVVPIAAELQSRAQVGDLGVAAHLLAALELALVQSRATIGGRGIVALAPVLDADELSPELPR